MARLTTTLLAPTQSFDADTALSFLNALGKDPAQTWFRTLQGGRANRSRSGADLHGFNAQVLEADSTAGDNLYLVIGNASAASGKSGGITDADITSMPALFVEWDDRPQHEQLQAWQELGLPEPSLMVATGGKSIHCYWLLQEPISPAEWKATTNRLIEHCGSDQACKNPSRVMRLPGSAYRDKKSGEVTGRAKILHTTEHRYSVSEIETCLSPPPAATPSATATSFVNRKKLAKGLKTNLPPRSLDEIKAAAKFIPDRIGGEGSYADDRDALCGCSAALAAIGHPNPDGMALELLADKWKDGDPKQVLASATTRDEDSFWRIAERHGFDLRLKQLAKAGVEGETRQRRRNQRRLSHDRAMAAFDRCVEVQAQRQRNSLTRRARLLKVAKDLGLSSYINRQEIAQRVLEAKDRATGNRFEALSAADRLAIPTPSVEWLVTGLIPAGDLTIIGGRPKVGKTRLALAIAQAVLEGGEWLSYSVPQSRPVLLVSDDQADGDTGDMLKALGIWLHPQLVWSSHFRLTERDMEALLKSIRAHPGALVILDSLRSISRSMQYGENDPELGAALYDLKAAVIEAGGTLALVHHCNKSEGLVGTEALSGHNAIAGATNTVLTLHYLPGPDGKPVKDGPQRRLVREARSGDGFDVVISRTESGGGFCRLGPFSEWERQIKESVKETKTLEKLGCSQKEVLAVLEEAGCPLTRRAICEALEIDWGARGKNPEAKRVEKILSQLAGYGFITGVRDGTATSWELSSRVIPPEREDNGAS